MEVWKPVLGYENLYSVSNLGRVKSLERKVKNKNGYRVVQERILSPGRSGKARHFYVQLWKNDEGKPRYVHTLVLEAFTGPRPVAMECRHLNGNVEDNYWENLVWDYHVINEHDKAIHGTLVRGEQSNLSKLKAEDVIKIRNDPRTAEVIAKEYGVHQQTIYRVKWKETW